MTHPTQPLQTATDAGTPNPQNTTDAADQFASPFDNPVDNTAAPSNVANPFAEDAEPIAESSPPNPFADDQAGSDVDATTEPVANPFAEAGNDSDVDATPKPAANPFADAGIATGTTATTEVAAQPETVDNPFADENADDVSVDVGTEAVDNADEQQDSAMPTATGEPAVDTNETAAVVEQPTRADNAPPADGDLMTTVWAVLPWLALLPLAGLIYYTWRQIRGGNDFDDYPRESSRGTDTMQKTVRPSTAELNAVSDKLEPELTTENHFDDDLALGDDVPEEVGSLDDGLIFQNMLPVEDEVPSTDSSAIAASSASLADDLDVTVMTDIGDDNDDDFNASWIEDAENEAGDVADGPDQSDSVLPFSPLSSLIGQHADSSEMEADDADITENLDAAVTTNLDADDDDFGAGWIEDAESETEDDALSEIAADSDLEADSDNSDSVVPFASTPAPMLAAVEQHDDSSESLFDDDDSAESLFDEDDDDIDLASEWDEEIVATNDDSKVSFDFDDPSESTPADAVGNLAFPGVETDHLETASASISDGPSDESSISDAVAPIAALGVGIAALAGVDALKAQPAEEDEEIALKNEKDADPFDFSAELEDNAPMATATPRLADIHEETETELELQRELDRAVARINEVESQHDQLQAEFNLLQGENTELAENVKSFNEKQNESTALATDLESVKQQLTETETEKQKLTDELESQQRQLTDELDAKQQIIDSIEADREELEQLRAEKAEAANVVPDTSEADSLRAELESLRTEQDSLRQANGLLEEQIADKETPDETESELEAHCDRLTEKVNMANRRRKKAERQLAKLKTAAPVPMPAPAMDDGATERLNDLESKNESLQEELNRAQEQLDAAAREQESAESRFETQLTDAKRQHEEELTELKAAVPAVDEVTEQKMVDLESKNETLQKELNRAQEQLDAATQEQKSAESKLESQLADTKQQHDESIAAAEKQHQETQDRLQQLQKEHDEAHSLATHTDSELETLRSQLNDANGSTEILEKKIESLAQESEQYRESVQMLRDESNGHREKLDATLGEAEQLKLAVQKAEQERDQLDEQYSTAAMERDSMRAELADAKEKISAASEGEKQKIDGLEQRLTVLVSEAEKRDAELAEFKRQTASKEEMVAGLASLTTEKSKLTEQLSASEQTSEMTRRQLAAMKEQLDRANDERQEAKTLLEHSLAEKEAVEQKMKEVSEQHLSQMDKLQTQIDELQRNSRKTSTVRRDNLKRISGITPKIETLLRAAGLDSFENLSAATPAALQNVIETAGKRYQKLDPSSWPKEARIAATGNWDELKSFQDSQ